MVAAQARKDLTLKLNDHAHGEQQVPQGHLQMWDHILTSLYELDYEPADKGIKGDDHGRKHRHNKKGREKWCKTLLHALHRVHDTNVKLRSFERGLISKDGIKDREWCKHLGVGPGKWLGYGATTFPGLTEAIIYDNDKKAAGHELKRLCGLIKNMVQNLAV